MSWPPLLANENVPRRLVAELRRLGAQVECVGDSMPAVSDRAVLEHAAAHALWILTFDRDYGELVFARAVAPPPAIIYVRQQARRPEELARDVMAVLAQPDFVRGHLIVMSERRMRRRALPL